MAKKKKLTQEYGARDSLSIFKKTYVIKVLE